MGIGKRAISFLLKAFVISVAAAAIIIGCAALFMKFYGNAILERSLSAMLGSQVKFRSAALDLDKGAVSFSGFSVISEIDLTSKAFNAEKVTVLLNKERFDREKKIVLDELYVNKGILNIVRLKTGAFILASAGRRDPAPGGSGLAYAEETPGGALYNFARSMRKITIEDSVINFNDYLITGSPDPYYLYCDRFNFNLVSKQAPDPAGSIPVELSMTLGIPTLKTGSGTLGMAASMAVYPDRVDMEANLDTRGVNLMILQPYLTRSTPFLFSEAIISSGTSFRMHNKMIDSLTTIVFHRLRFSVKPGMDNAQFLAASVNRIAKYLTSSGGDITFDFVIRGPADKPAVGLGPKVKFAIGMVVIEEVAKAVQQMQQVQR